MLEFFGSLRKGSNFASSKRNKIFNYTQMEERIYIIKQDELDSIKSELQEIKALVMEGQKNSSSQDELVDVQTAAAMFHITPRCLSNWVKKLGLSYTQIGRRRLFSQKALQALIDRNTLNNK